MIDARTAKMEIERLKFSALNYPPEGEGLAALVKALAKHAKSERHAALVIERWIETWPQWPKPSEIVQSCGLVVDPVQEAIQRNRQECERCGGSGWISVAGPFGTSAAYPCSHAAETAADRRMGVKIEPAVATRYADLERQGKPYREVWVGSGGKPNMAAIKAIMERVHDQR